MAKVILFQGDSITDSGRDRNNDFYNLGFGYPTLVKAELGCKYPNEYEFHNKGVSGDKIFNVYARSAMDIFNINPDYMSILIGVNDVWHGLDIGRNTGTERFEDVYDLMIRDIMKTMPQTKLMIMEPFALKGTATDNTETQPDRLEKFLGKTKEAAAAAKRIAEKYNLVFIPLQSVFDEACKIAPENYWLIDGVHPTAMGHNLIKTEWIKAFESIK